MSGGSTSDDEHAMHEMGGMQIICKPEKMIVSEWLRPVYDGVPEIVCGLSVQLAARGDILASGNADSTQSMVLDAFPEPGSLLWGSVRRLGAGYIALLAGSVTADVWLQGRSCQRWGTC